MTMPQAYEPANGYKFQILTRNPTCGMAWEHCDYAIDRSDRNYLLSNYRMAYGGGWEFKVITLPRKYWPKPQCDVEGRSQVSRPAAGKKQLVS